ncbi:uncharacterized protein LACBIDRAFT_313522 [Laccaria bicolor S238N-H82]|uniref:Predicted protein n=1 Tax=Laccaria bicolor (strain S238N-H82 / ATCC MYA-4686) TaxID=486041 RepID=B0D067_LACBS|nr:uncharacterized protein LACBIDRAFT_313522 [Laccaria bicolor S238N-H82]EDR11401.1 predicted protein [Laccaria bicolor S238N-H82]|eukprot:XP_001877298.1 predicted protein [Laccaria bicolor S238N-H82]
MDKLYEKFIKYLNRTFHLTIILPAFAMCAGPLFAPYPGLPLAQQHQWMHVCDSFTGEASNHPPSVLLDNLSFFTSRLLEHHLSSGSQ